MAMTTEELLALLERERRAGMTHRTSSGSSDRPPTTWEDVGRGVSRGGAALVGAPVDIVNLALAGKGGDSPVMGGKWVVDKLHGMGILPPEPETAGGKASELLTGLLDPSKAGLFAGALGATKAVGSTAKALKKKGAIGTIFDNVTDTNEATRMALRGDHLKRDPDGKYIGAPAKVTSPQSLGGVRADALDFVRSGAWNADWYDRQRNLATSISDDPTMQSLFARGTAAYSPQAMPKVELPSFLRQHNEKVLTNTDVVPRTESQARNVMRAYSIDPNTGKFVFNPDAIILGKKTGPYADAKDPTIDDWKLYKTANDIWHGRVMGYGDDFSRGFTPQEHGYLTGENLVLSDSATKAGIPIGSHDVTSSYQWTPRRAQAATWGGARFEQLKAKDAAKFAKQEKARAKYDADPEKWKKRNPGKSPPPKPTPVRTDEQLREYAMQGLDTAVPDQTLTLTNEAVTGANVGHLPMQGWDDAAKRQYTDEIQAATGRDPTVEGLGLFSRKAGPTQGEWTNSAGQVERNPGWADEVLVSNAKTPIGRGTPHSEKEAVNLALQISALLRAQEAGGASRFIKMGSPGLRVRDTNAIAIRGATPDQVSAARDAAGASMIDQGGQQILTRFGNAGPLPGTGPDMAKRIDPNLKGKRGLLEGYSQDGITPAEEAGSGKATTALLESLDKSGLYDVWGRMDRSRWPEVAARYNEIDAAKSAATGAPLREDLMRLRKLIAEGGFTGVRDHVKKYGAYGLPAAGGVSLGLLPEDESQGWGY